MGLYKRRDSDSWWTFVSYNGIQIRKSCRTTDRALAEQREQEWREELATNGYDFNAKLRKANEKTGVYFIRMEGTDYVKIGWALNVDHRLLDLQTANPHRLILEVHFTCNDPQLFEFRTHRHFSDKHVRGEWFRLTEAEVEAFSSRYEKRAEDDCA